MFAPTSSTTSSGRTMVAQHVLIWVASARHEEHLRRALLARPWQIIPCRRVERSACSPRVLDPGPVRPKRRSGSD
jgi:hypothetical protein